MSSDLPLSRVALAHLARQALALDDAALAAECEEEFWTAGGPGGQHRNKTQSAVRLVHRPTGIGVNATERRSQSQNRGQALERLRERLKALSVLPKPRKATRPSRSAQRKRLDSKRKTAEKKNLRRRSFD